MFLMSLSQRRSAHYKVNFNDTHKVLLSVQVCDGRWHVVRCSNNPENPNGFRGWAVISAIQLNKIKLSGMRRNSNRKKIIYKYAWNKRVRRDKTTCSTSPFYIVLPLERYAIPIYRKWRRTMSDSGLRKHVKIIMLKRPKKQWLKTVFKNRSPELKKGQIAISIFNY